MKLLLGKNKKDIIEVKGREELNKLILNDNKRRRKIVYNNNIYYKTREVTGLDGIEELELFITEDNKYMIIPRFDDYEVVDARLAENVLHAIDFKGKNKLLINDFIAVFMHYNSDSYLNELNDIFLDEVEELYLLDYFQEDVKKWFKALESGGFDFTTMLKVVYD